MRVEKIRMVDSTSEFHEKLASLLSEAAENGIEATGGWDVHDADENTDWTVEITELSNESVECGLRES